MPELGHRDLQLRGRRQVVADPTALDEYGRRDETRREHLAHLLQTFGWQTIDPAAYRHLSGWLREVARGVD
jgi:hypothetical protein